METIKRNIVQKTVDCLAEEGMKYVGKTLIQSFNYCMMGNFACFFAFFWRLLIKCRSKQSGHRSDCSNRSSLFWGHTVCHRGFLNISVDEKKADDFCYDWPFKV